MICFLVALFQTFNASSLSGHYTSTAGSPYNYTVNASPRPQVFYDFDMDSDCDDLVDCVLLLNLEHMGKCDIIGATATSANLACACFSSIANYYGRLAIPLGINTNSVGNGGDTYDSYIANNYGVPGRTNFSQFTNSVTITRTVLAGAAANSIEYITTGDLSSVNKLLVSSADGISPLNGTDLVAAKIRNLWVVAGNWPSGAAVSDFGATPACTTNSAQFLVNWPTTVPVIFDNLVDGNAVLTGGTVMESLVSTNPARVAWEHFFGNSNPSNSRGGWSQIAILPMMLGVYPNSTTATNYSGFGQTHGTAMIGGDGTTFWANNLDSQHNFLLKMLATATYITAINNLIKDPSVW